MEDDLTPARTSAEKGKGKGKVEKGSLSPIEALRRLGPEVLHDLLWSMGHETADTNEDVMVNTIAMAVAHKVQTFGDVLPGGEETDGEDEELQADDEVLSDVDADLKKAIEASKTTQATVSR